VLVLGFLLFLTGCSISTEEISTAAAERAGVLPVEGTLPAIGPIPASSHWHAAYVVRICDEVLAPFDSAEDPLGIHSHADGVMHIHPFFDESGYEAATISLFGDAMGFELSQGELTLPGGGTWRDGDLCDGVPGRVFVDRWASSSPDSAIERIFEDPGNIRYLADGELYQIAFAPADSLPVVPPSQPILSELSNLGPAPEPWIDVDETTTGAQASFRVVESISSEPCEAEQLPERVLSGPVRCFVTATDTVGAIDGVESARAVMFNRRPSVEVRMSRPLQTFIEANFANGRESVVLAVEVDGSVITAPQLSRPPTGDRLVVSGGFSVETATALAAILNGDN